MPKLPDAAFFKMSWSQPGLGGGSLMVGAGDSPVPIGTWDKFTLSAAWKKKSLPPIEGTGSLLHIDHTKVWGWIYRLKF